MLDRATASAPASIGNVGVGFDVLGQAFDAARDTVMAVREEHMGVRLGEVTGLMRALPIEVPRNTALTAAAAVLDAGDADFGLRLSIDKGVPMSAGNGRVRRFGSGRCCRSQRAVAAAIHAGGTAAVRDRGRARLLRSAAVGQCHRRALRRAGARRARGASGADPAVAGAGRGGRGAVPPQGRDRDAGGAWHPQGSGADARRGRAFAQTGVVRGRLHDRRHRPYPRRPRRHIGGAAAGAPAAGAPGGEEGGAGRRRARLLLLGVPARRCSPGCSRKRPKRSRRRWPPPSAAKASRPAPIARSSIRRASGSKPLSSRLRRAA